jgi:hypothetical protein
MVDPRSMHVAVRLADGRVLIVGGTDAFGRTIATAEVYDPKTGTFSSTGSMASDRYWPVATLLSDGRVFVAGGQGNATGPRDAQGDFPGNAPVASAELWDPSTGRFHFAGQ